MRKTVKKAIIPAAGLGTRFLPAIFDILENQEPGKGGEIQLTDALKTLATHEAIYAYNFEGRRYDVGDKRCFLEATIDFALKRHELKDDLMYFIKSKVDVDKVVEKEIYVIDEVALAVE